MALVVTHLKGGGKEQCVVNLANQLPAAGVRTIVICLESGGRLAKNIRHPDVPVIEMHKRPGNDVTLPFRLARVLRERQVTVVNSHNWGPLVEGTVASAIAGCAIVHTQHGLDYEVGHQRHGAKRWWRLAAKRLVARRLAAVIAVSSEVATMVAQEWRAPALPVSVILNGVGAIATPDAATREAIRSELGAGPADVLIGSVGHLRPVKDYVTLVEAFGTARQRCPALRLVLAGDGPSRADVERAVDRTGTTDVVRLLGVVRDVPRMLPALDVFALSSISEGLSIAILEAGSAGLPVVATRVGGNPEIVEDGQSGLLVPAGQPGAMADALARIGQDAALRAKMGARGREIVEQRFSLSRMAADYAGVFASAAGRRR